LAAYDLPKSIVLDRDYTKEFDLIKSMLISRQKTAIDFMIEATSNDFNVWLVSALDDQNPEMYYLYNRTTKSLQFLFASKCY